jgi:hypothetical protein
VNLLYYLFLLDFEQMPISANMPVDSKIGIGDCSIPATTPRNINGNPKSPDTSTQIEIALVYNTFHTPIIGCGIRIRHHPAK